MGISLPILHQTLAIVPVVFASFMNGISLGWLPPTLKNYRNATGDFSLSDNDCSWMVSLQYLGHLSGCLLVIQIVDRFGRNAAISISAIMFVLSWIGVTLTTKTTLHLMIRLLIGISMGLNLPVIAIYVGENSSPTLRGVFGSCISLFFYGGILVGCTVTTYFSYKTTCYIFVAVSLVNLSLGVLLQEPAQYLLMKRRVTEAENQFFRLRGSGEKMQEEFEDLRSNLATGRPKFSLSVIFNRYLLITCTISFLIYFTGHPAVSPQVTLILVPTDQLSTNELAIILQLCQLVGAIISPFIIKYFGRRTLWMVSATCIALIHSLTAALYLARENSFEVPINEWLLFGSVTAYEVIFSAALFPLVIIAKSELLPQRIRTVGASIVSILNAFTSFIVGRSFFLITTNFGVTANFICYAVFSVVILAFSYFYLPETRGMSLTEIERTLENPKKKTTE